jgi:endonuclease YncB( thermonuclease family)
MSDADAEGLTDTRQSDPLATFNTRRRRGVRVTSAAAIALGLALAGGAVAGATTSTSPSTSSGPSAADHRPPMGGSPPAAVGTVVSVGTGTFTLTTSDNTTVTVNVGSTTTYRDAGVTTPTIANVTVGEHVAVFGIDTSNVVTATSVAIGNPSGGGPGGPGGPAGSPPAAVGTVASVGSGTFTLTTKDNTTVTVNVGTATTYRDAGVTTPTIANVTVGEHVAVFGTDTSNVVTATSVAIGDPPSGGPGGNGPSGSGGPGGPDGHGGSPPSGGWSGSSSTSTSG